MKMILQQAASLLGSLAAIARYREAQYKQVRVPVGFRSNTGKTYAANGERECARRRLQISKGTLKVTP